MIDIYLRRADSRSHNHHPSPIRKAFANWIYAMSSPSSSKIVQSAVTEWKYWGKNTWNCIKNEKSQLKHNDDDSDFARYIIETYLSPFYKVPIIWPTPALISEDNYAWSAVTISYFMRQAGFARKKLLPDKHTDQQYASWVAASKLNEFPISESHSHYIRWAIRARKDGVTTAAYWGYRVDEAAAVPEVGDLIGYPRAKEMTSAKALKFFDKKSNYQSHTDLVVAKRAGEIDVIGGNVRDSVTKKTLKIDSAGRIADKTFFWFVVLKRR